MTPNRLTRPLRLELVPVGISRAAHGLFWVGICFCIGVAVIGMAMLVFPHIGSTVKGVHVPPTHEPMPWPVWVGMGAFAAVSIGVTLGGINMGMRRAVIEVRGDRLSIEQKDLFGTRRMQLRADEIAKVDARATEISVGGTRKRHGVDRVVKGKSIHALYIDLKNGHTIRLVMGRDRNELDAIAAQLREAVGCGEDTGYYPVSRRSSGKACAASPARRRS